MQDWKIRQEIYHRLNTTFDDDLKTKDIVITNNIVEDAVRYFFEKDIGWIYPSKSYMVAICYARWLTENFGGNYLNYLNDVDLLHGNDPYYQIYSDDEEIYNKILLEIGGWNFDQLSGMVPDVKKYFMKEFLFTDSQ